MKNTKKIRFTDYFTLRTINRFEEKFKAIPPRLWTTGTFRDQDGRYCVLGHCGCRDRDEMTASGLYLVSLFGKYGLEISQVNDGYSIGFQQRTPRARVLAALRVIRGYITSRR